MDAAQLAELRAWARRLEARADDAELRAAGKALLLLVDEVERLTAPAEAAVADDDGGARARAAPAEAAAPVETDTGGDGGPADATLRERLRRAFGYGDA
jgi:hypothetical protein